MGNWYSSRVATDIHPLEGSAPVFAEADQEGNLSKRVRVQRVMKVPDEELSALQVPLEKRDYCAHIWVEYLKCRRDTYPFMTRCSYIHHDWQHCEYEDHIMRMKEYERERRILESTRRKGLIGGNEDI